MDHLMAGQMVASMVEQLEMMTADMLAAQLAA
jgi:hypothetical protein